MHTLDVAATKTHFAAVSTDWEEVRRLVKQSAETEVAAMNLLRGIGISLQSAAKREQISMAFLEAHKDDLPGSLTLKAARLAVHLAQTNPEPIKTLGEARAARQMMFSVFGEAEIPHRKTAQIARGHNPWSEFVAVSATLTGLFSTLEETPMEDWGRANLETFVRETEPIVARHQRAKGILA
jgi:hypothetical protein